MIKKYIFLTVLLILFGVFGVLFNFNKKIISIYNNNQSFRVIDRNDKVMFLEKNVKGNYAEYSDIIPEKFKNLLIKKEDKYFYNHWGFNVFAIVQALGNKFGLSSRQASSTITQQLAKILLEKENNRNINNKLEEALYSLSLETFNTKDDILKMYINSIYFGNQIQGLESASKAYFGVAPQNLTEGQIFQLLATVNSPTDNNPSEASNIERAKNLKTETFTDSRICQNNLRRFFESNQPILELKDFKANNDIKFTIDRDLNDKVRSIILYNIETLKTKKAKNAAAVILSIPDNKILAIVGSPDPASYSDGYQINMATKPRQIGSTIKPFIYLLGFKKGMRPYTIIDDREYKYSTADGYSIYPKNFDYKYHGLMTAHYALSNSINVAAVKTLDFIGLESFSDFLTKDLDYSPPQPIDQYQLGIALGSLEMDLLNLSHYFSIFPNQGKLTNLKMLENENNQEKTIISKEYTELINKILNDRQTGIDQFGAKSDLNLPAANYSLKTGTSHDFTDSWVIGYTPDFLIGVWVGNADNSATDGISGQLGAGKIWNQLMQVMLNSSYNHNSQFDFSDLKEYRSVDGIDFGLSQDDFYKSQNIIEKEDNLILSPYNGDIFLFEDNSKIVLKSKEIANWKINNIDYGFDKEIIFQPKKEGRYEITASSSSKSETISIQFLTTW